MLWKVKITYVRMRGSWSDIYVLEANSEAKAEQLLLDYIEEQESPYMLVTAEEINVSEPYLIVEG